MGFPDNTGQVGFAYLIGNVSSVLNHRLGWWTGKKSTGEQSSVYLCHDLGRMLKEVIWHPEDRNWHLGVGKASGHCPSVSGIHGQDSVSQEGPHHASISQGFGTHLNLYVEKSEYLVQRPRLGKKVNLTGFIVLKRISIGFHWPIPESYCRGLNCVFPREMFFLNPGNYDYDLIWK